MTHQFDVEIAKEYGVDIAIVVNNIAFWIQKNKANEKHIHDGKVWTYNTTKAFTELFPYWTDNQIRRILFNMQKKGIIETGNYNLTAYDRTKWYTFTDAFVKTHTSICENTQMDLTKQPNGFEGNHEPIPDNKQIDKPDNIPYTEIIDYLNEKSGSKYRNIKNTRDFIKARFNEGFTKEDFFKVIDNKVSSWTGSEFEKFIRPQTLFSPKFESYLNEKPIEKKHTGSKEGYQVDISKYDTL
jgi:uncharacterized phage protein (TIGR02220 family)